MRFVCALIVAVLACATVTTANTYNKQTRPCGDVSGMPTNKCHVCQYHSSCHTAAYWDVFGFFDLEKECGTGWHPNGLLGQSYSGCGDWAWQSQYQLECYKCCNGFGGSECNQPSCDNPKCVHGTCYSYNKCRCNSGWKKDSNGGCTVPICDGGCGYGTCTAPNTCSCPDNGLWKKDSSGKCTIPVCDPGCVNGKCIFRSPNTTVCDCEYKWGGAQCNQPICRDACDTRFATCPGPNSCVCDANHYGPLCTSECTCKHGTCSSGNSGNGACTKCDADWAGPDCDTACTCVHGQCSQGPSGDGLCTSCTADYFGSNCDQKCTCVADHTEKCLDGITGSGACVCKEGFRGDNCEVVNNPCETNDCHADAICTALSNTEHECKCKTGYKDKTGSTPGTDCEPVNQCESVVCPCYQRPCSETCTYDGPGQYSCKCKAGYQGNGKDFCMAINKCISDGTSPCDESAYCLMTGPGTFKCQCFPNLYKGVGDDSDKWGLPGMCEPINPCDNPNYCAANTTCTYYGPGVASCACKEGFVGDPTVVGCERQDLCDRKRWPNDYPCYHAFGQESEADALCEPMAEPGKYKCTCPLPKYEGDGEKFCKGVDNCDDPQLHGCSANAECRPTGPGENECQCPLGRHGTGYVADGESGKCKLDNPCHEVENPPCIDAGNMTMCVNPSKGNYYCKCQDIVSAPYNKTLMYELHYQNLTMFPKDSEFASKYQTFNDTDENVFCLYIPANERQQVFIEGSEGGFGIGAIVGIICGALLLVVIVGFVVYRNRVQDRLGPMDTLEYTDPSKIEIEGVQSNPLFSGYNPTYDPAGMKAGGAE